MAIKLVATRIRSGRYAVRPEGQRGTHGWYPMPWTVRYVNARSEEEAIKKVEKMEKKS